MGGVGFFSKADGRGDAGGVDSVRGVVEVYVVLGDAASEADFPVGGAWVVGGGGVVVGLFGDGADEGGEAGTGREGEGDVAVEVFFPVFADGQAFAEVEADVEADEIVEGVGGGAAGGVALLGEFGVGAGADGGEEVGVEPIAACVPGDSADGPTGCEVVRGDEADEGAGGGELCDSRGGGEGLCSLCGDGEWRWARQVFDVWHNERGLFGALRGRRVERFLFGKRRESC